MMFTQTGKVEASRRLAFRKRAVCPRVLNLMRIGRFWYWGSAGHLDHVFLPNAVLLQPNYGLSGGVHCGCLPFGAPSPRYQCGHNCNVSVNSNLHIARFELRSLVI